MEKEFSEPLFREVDVNNNSVRGNVIKAASASVNGITRISVEEESEEGVKIVLKKDPSDNVKEIKFICSCGQTKTIVLNYSE